MTDIYLTQSQIDTIRSYQTRGVNAQGNYSDVYAAIAQMLPVGSNVRRWFEGAAQANAGQGVFSTVIRAYSQKQMELRGIAYSDALMQAASNRVAVRALEDILSRQQADGRWLAPTIESIADKDATGVGETLFAGLSGADTAKPPNNAAWSGTILFSALGLNQTERLTRQGGADLNTLDDIKNVLFAYESYGKAWVAAGIVATTEAVIASLPSEWLSFDKQFATDAGIAWDTLKTTPANDLIGIGFKRLTALLSGDAQKLGKLIESTSPAQVLDWLRSAYEGKRVTGTSSDGFGAAATSFFGGIGSVNAQGITAKVLASSKTELIAQAKQDMSVRNALVALSPIAITRPSYQHDLSLMNKEADTGALSDEWLDKRASFLIFERLYKESGQSGSTFSMPAGLPVPMVGDIDFKDFSADGTYSLKVDGVDLGVASTKVVAFGSDQANALSGGDGKDFLFGMGGDDVLKGGSDDDYLEGAAGNDKLHGEGGSDTLWGGQGDDLLEGGAGNDQLKGGTGSDRYTFDAGYGSDVINDQDGQGSVVIGGAIVKGGKKEEGKSYYEDKDTGTVYQWFGDTLTIARKGVSGQVKVEDWSNGELGIRLTEEVKKPKQVVSPIVLDMDGDGIETTGLLAQTHFDHDGDGFAELTGWAAPDDGLLVRDLNGNGQIDSGAELFGTNTAGTNNTLAANGFVALSNLDGNKDNLISGAELNTLGVWRDTNQNGKVDQGELLSAVEAGIKSISTNYTNSSTADANGNQHRQIGSYTSTSGQTRSAVDVWFATDRSDSIAKPLGQPLPADVLALPDIEGYGTTRSLRESMASNLQLKSLVQQFVQATDSAIRPSLMKDILWQWTGASDQGRYSRGAYIEDARWLYMVDGLTGQPYKQLDGTNAGTSDPGPAAVIEIYTTSRKLVELFYGRLMAATHLKSLYSAITPTWDEQAATFLVDYSQVVELLSSAIVRDRTTGSALLSDFMLSLRGQGLATQAALDQLSSGLSSLGSDIQSSVFTVTLLELGLARAIWEGTNLKDSLVDSEGANAAFGLAGNDTLDGKAGNDTLYGGIGDDVLYGGSDNDTLFGGSGNDTLDGGAGNDLLKGGSGSPLDSDSGADVYMFSIGSGQDTIDNRSADVVGTSPDTILLGSGIGTADVSLTKSTNDLIVSINGTSDRLIVKDYFYDGGTSQHVVENFKFASGVTWDVKAVLNKFTISTDGADVLYGTPDADVIDGKAGNDTIYAGLGSDTYKFGKGDGRDLIASSDDPAVGKIDTLLFKPGVAPSEVTFGTAPDPAWWSQQGGGDALVIRIAGSTDQVLIQDFLDNSDPANTRNPLQQIKFDDGTTWGIQTILSKLYAGTNSADIIDGTSKGELITGGAGNDSLYGNNGRDTLDGGTGNDYIYEGGDDGNDTFLFGKGDGKDTIGGNQDSEPGEVNTLLFKAGVAPSEITLATYSSDLIIKIANSTDQIVAEDFLYDGYPANGYAFQQIKFADGTTWNTAAILSKLYAGTDSADRLDGTIYAEAINGQSGDDSLFGGDGGDTLDGGVGNDYINGGGGSDTYIFGIGDGQDTIAETYGDATSAKIDTLSFKPGVTPSDVVLNTAGTALIINFAGTSDQITVREFFYQNTPTSKVNPLQQIKFADGTVWDIAAIVSRLPSGASAGDLIRGTSSGDVISGLAGNDSLYGNDGNDTLDGGSDDDLVYGGLGNDVSYGGVGSDSLHGEAGADTLDGGVGNDYISGGLGSDTYLFGKGDGQDTIASIEDATAGKVDTLLFKPGVAPTDITFGTSDSSLLVKINGSTDQVTVNYFLYASNPASSYNPLQQINFADGTKWNISAILSRLYTGTDSADGFIGTVNADVINGFGGGDYLYGGGGNDSLNGGAGVDTLDGGNGDDLLQGGAGDDYLKGDVGNDTYIFAKGDGIDSISDYNPAPGNLDAISFTDVKSAEMISVSRLSNHALILQYGLTDTVSVQSFFETAYTTSYQVEKITFADGVVWSLNDILKNAIYRGTTGHDALTSFANGVNRVEGGDGNDTVTGADHADTLSGGAGNDSLYGGSGDDLIYGGTGQDTLYGGAGADTYVYNKGDGLDVIYGQRTEDTLLMKGFKSADVIFKRQLSDINILNATSAPGYDLATLVNQALDGINEQTGVSQIIFDDKTITADDIRKLALKGTAGNDTNLRGYMTNDAIDGGQGNDWLYGEDGNDTLDGGEGADAMYGGLGDDLYHVDDAADLVVEGVDTGSDTVDTTLSDYVLPDNVENLIMNGKAEVNTASGNAQDNQIQGTWLDDHISSLDGNDTILSDDGNDTLDGGLGHDILEGGAGNDVYYVDQTLMSNDDFLPDEVLEFDDNAGGIDTVHTEIGDYVLPANVENLVMTGKSAYGNELNNHITGSDASNQIDAGAGHDTLIGLDGDDELTGAEGNDQYVGGVGDDTLIDIAGNEHYTWGRGEGSDIISDGGGSDELHILAGVSAEQIWLRQEGQALELQVIGTHDRVRINGWFTNAVNQIESFELANGKALSNSNVQALVSAMAGFTPPPQGQTNLTAEQQAQLGQVIASNWV